MCKGFDEDKAHESEHWRWGRRFFDFLKKETEPLAKNHKVCLEFWQDAQSRKRPRICRNPSVFVQRQSILAPFKKTSQRNLTEKF